MPESVQGAPPDNLTVAFDTVELKKRSVHGSVATLVAQAITFASKFGVIVVLGRLLSPAEFGLVAMVTPILGFVGTFNDLGFAQAIIQKKEINDRQISALFWMNFAVSLALAAILAIAAPIVGSAYKEPRTVGVMLGMSTLMIISTVGMVPKALLRRKMRFIPAIALDMVGMVAGSAASIVAALMGASYWSLVIGQAVTAVLTAGLAYLYAGWLPSRPARDPELKQMMRFGANLTAVNLATYFSMTADNMIVGIFAGKIPLGLYDRSYNLTVQPLSQLMLPVSQVSIPLLSRLQDKPDLFRRSYLTMVRLALLLSMPAMLVCLLFSGPVIRVLLGKQWDAAAPIFAWICLGGLFAPLFSSTGWVFTTQGQTGKQMVVAVITAIVSIVSFAIGIFWGAIGVAAVSAMSFTFVQLPIMIRAVTRVGPVTVRDIVNILAPFVATAAIVAVPLYFLRGLSGLPALAGVGLLSYALFALCIRLLPGGRAFFDMVIGLRHMLRRSA
ncbi:MAG: lipopolysaccharide biosynthesis protein [Ignavibacteriota bacterium]